MVASDSKWQQVVASGSKWQQVVASGSRSDGSKWQKVVAQFQFGYTEFHQLLGVGGVCQFDIKANSAQPSWSWGLAWQQVGATVIHDLVRHQLHDLVPSGARGQLCYCGQQVQSQWENHGGAIRAGRVNTTFSTLFPDFHWSHAEWVVGRNN